MAENNEKLQEKLNNTPAVQGEKKPLTVADQVQRYLDSPKMREQLAKALPKHLTADRLSRVALTTIRTNQKLLQCTVESLIAVIVMAAQLGLEPGLLGHVYFVPFRRNIAKKGEPPKYVFDVQFIIGYKGLLDLARRTGDIETIAAHPIYSKDTFHVEYGYNQVLKHIPEFGDRGKLIGFYAFALTKDGGRYCEVMSLEEVEKIRKRSKAADDGPWVTDFSEMGRKTVLRRLCKYLPLSIEITEQIREDEEKEFGDATAIELNLGEPKPTVVETPKAIEHTEAEFVEVELPKRDEAEQAKVAEAANERLKKNRESAKQKQQQKEQPKEEQPDAEAQNVVDYVLASGPLVGTKLGELDQGELVDLAKEAEFLTEKDREMVNAALGRLQPIEA